MRDWHPHDNADAIITGGGVVGLACAIELRRRGFETVLIEAERDPRGASWGNAGHIATEQVEPLASRANILGLPRRLYCMGGPVSFPLSAWRSWLPFGRAMASAARTQHFATGKDALASVLAEAMPAWRRLLGRAGAGELLREHGHLILWESSATATAGAARWRKAAIGTARVLALTVEELASVRKLVSTHIAGGVRFAGSGQIRDLGELADRLGAHYQSIGGLRRFGLAESVLQHDGGISIRLADGTTATADVAVIAAGVGSAALLRPLGHRVPLIAERGYHIEAQADEAAWPEDTPPIVFEDRAMIVTRFRSTLRAASFVEFAPVERPPDPRKWQRLRRHAAALGLPVGRKAQEWMGARPTFPDYLPAIGRSALVPQLFYAFGHQHLGLTLAAMTGEAIGALAAGESPAVDLAPFDVARFGHARS